MSFYQRITPLQDPFDLGSDQGGAYMCGFNVMATRQPSSTFIEELAKRLNAQGVGTLGTNIFGSSAAAIPPGDGPVLSIIDTGGPSPLYEHNPAGPGVTFPAFVRSTAQLIARASTYAAARAMAWAAYDALVTVTNTTLTP